MGRRDESPERERTLPGPPPRSAAALVALVASSTGQAGADSHHPITLTRASTAASLAADAPLPWSSLAPTNGFVGSPSLLGLDPPQVTSFISKCQNIRELCTLLETGRDFATFNCIHVATALNRTGKLTQKSFDSHSGLPANYLSLFERLTRRVEQLADIVGPREIANIIHGVAVSHIFEMSEPYVRSACILFEIVCRTIEIHQVNLALYKSQDIANIMYGLAKANFTQSDVPRVITMHLNHRGIEAFNAQDVANTLWAMAKLAYGDPTFLNMVAEHILRRGLEDYKAQHIASVVWAMAKLSHASEDLMVLIASHLDQARLAKFESQHLSNIVYGLGLLGWREERFLNRLLDALGARDWSASDAVSIGNTCWSLAILGVPRQDIFAKTTKFCLDHGMVGFTSQNIANMIWSYATLNIQDWALFEIVAWNCNQTGFSAYTPHELALVLWSYGTMQVFDPTLTQRIGDELEMRDLGDFDTMQLGNIAWSMAVLGTHHPGLLGKIALECAQRPFHMFSTQDVINLTWAFTCCDMLRDVTVLHWLDRPDDFFFNRTKLDDARQIFDVLCAWRIDYGSDDPENLPHILKRATRGNWVRALVEANRRSEYFTSQTLMDVAENFDKLGCRCQINAVTPSGQCVDLMITTPSGAARYIQLDGPRRCLHDGVTLSGFTLFKHRLIAMSVPERAFATLRVSDWKQWPEPERVAFAKRVVLGGGR